MRVVDLLHELSACGVKVTTKRGRLRVDAPIGVLTPGLRGAISEYRSELLELVRDQCSWQVVNRNAVMSAVDFETEVERPQVSDETLIGLSQNVLCPKGARKFALLRLAMRCVSYHWKSGDAEHYGWIFDELVELGRDLDKLSLRESRSRLQSLCEKVGAAFEKRSVVHDSERLAGSLAAKEKASANPNSSADANTFASANSKEVNQMSVFAEVPKETLVGRGEHQAKIVAIGQPEKSKFDETKQSLKLTFEILSGKFKSEKLTKYFTLSLKSKANLGQVYRRLAGEPKQGERVDLERDLVGREVSIIVTHKDGEDGPYAVIEDVFAPDGAAEAVK
ncbi:hypothetical protein HYR54_00905 [Candidatus Acetothermia bacterium]|nr:hypothetical protein [Candidatus Acetothermia bacterium]